MTLRDVYDQPLFEILDTFSATYFDNGETVEGAENATPEDN